MAAQPPKAFSLPDGVLPETESVYWRPRVDARALRRMNRWWTLTTLAHVVPFTIAGAALIWVDPLIVPIALACLAHAWIIPELYAQRGANVVRPRRRAAAGPELVSLGLLGDLVDHEARELHARTGLVSEPGRLGLWLVGEAGALLVLPGARRVLCYCIGVNTRSAAAGKAGTGEAELPSGDRIAHLLLALRSDEEGFATVANIAFSGARWRVRRRLRKPMRPALERKALLAMMSNTAV